MKTAAQKLQHNIRELDALRQDMVLQSTGLSNQEKSIVFKKFHEVRIGVLLKAHFSNSERKKIEFIHGGFNGVMMAIEMVGKIDADTSSLEGIQRMFIFFRQMIADYKRGRRFVVKFPEEKMRVGAFPEYKF